MKNRSFRLVLVLILITVAIVGACAKPAPPPTPSPPTPTPAPAPAPEPTPPPTELPWITSLTVRRAAPGTEVVITGDNFFDLRGSNVVSIGEVAAPVVFASASELRILVPATPLGEMPLSVLTPEGQSDEVTFETLPLLPPGLPVAPRTLNVLELSDSLLERLSREPAASEYAQRIEDTRLRLSEAMELVLEAEKELVRPIDAILSNARVEQRFDELLQALASTPHVSERTIAGMIEAAAGFAFLVIGVLTGGVVGVALIATGAVGGTAGLLAAIYDVDEDLERQRKQSSSQS